MQYSSQISSFLDKKEETAWQRASATLEATAKIYGYRVDSVHSDAYRILGGLNRTQHNDNKEENNDLENFKKDDEDKHIKYVSSNKIIILNNLFLDS